MSKDIEFSITPDTKIGALLEKFPELEETLVELAPSFDKLKNPFLRKTVAKIATIRQTATIGNVPLGQMVNTLRAKAGLSKETFVDDEAGYGTTPPAWYSASSVVNTLDARPIIETGEHPLDQVMEKLPKLKDNEMFELIAPFVPAPMIDVAKNKGFKTWVMEKSANEIHTFFGKV